MAIKITFLNFLALYALYYVFSSVKWFAKPQDYESAIKDFNLKLKLQKD